LYLQVVGKFVDGKFELIKRQLWATLMLRLLNSGSTVWFKAL